MGNLECHNVEEGPNPLPRSYLREVRILTDKRLKEISTEKTHRGSSVIKKKLRGSVNELNNKSVATYLVKNPNFLDSFVIRHVAQDRMKAWLRESKDRAGGSVKDDSDPEFAAELMERSFRHRQILLITRSRLFYPFRYKRDELNELIERAYSEEYEDEIESHLFPYTEIPSEDINKVFVLMVTNLLGKYAFPQAQLCYFLSCLKSNYYNIEYHNYSHALSHAQSMYWILSRNRKIFNELEMKCLLIAAIAHDVAHPGVNDSYLKTTGSGLDSLYMSPILEHHHTQTLFLILQDINCNVFSDLDGDDYKQVLDELQHDILSTSLARYKVQSENMRHMIATGLNFDSKKVRDSIKSVLMMACDLCASWKLWQEHKNTVWALYKEFFNQGDREIGFQIDSAPQMMRMNADKIPEYQVFFVENVVIPVFQIAVKVFPNIAEILDSTKENLDLWNTYL